MNRIEMVVVSAEEVQAQSREPQEGRRRHKLLTREIRKLLPKLGETEGQDDEAIVQVKFFCPYSDWTWYATEYDGVDMFMGLVDGCEEEYGPFSFHELVNLKMKVFGTEVPGIERDCHFKPRPLKECRRKKPCQDTPISDAV